MGADNGELESARVTRLLRDDIVLGRRSPGSRLVERDIATELHVSRLPVREAIRALVNEGIVVARPRSWAIVREFTLRDLRDFTEVRSAFEVQMFVLAAERHDAEGIEQLRRIVEREERAAGAGDVEGARMLAGAFHEHMAVLAGNEMLSELVGIFGARLKWLFGQHDDLEAMAAEHRRLYEAIRSREVDAVRVLASRHLEHGAAAAAKKFGAAIPPFEATEG